jgi:hypothetical protein
MREGMGIESAFTVNDSLKEKTTEADPYSFEDRHLQ